MLHEEKQNIGVLIFIFEKLIFVYLFMKSNAYIYLYVYLRISECIYI